MLPQKVVGRKREKDTSTTQNRCVDVFPMFNKKVKGQERPIEPHSETEMEAEPIEPELTEPDQIGSVPVETEPDPITESTNDPKSSLPEDMSKGDGGCPDKVKLWGKQYEAVKKVVSGESIFLTGPAGTGKSHVVNTLSTIMRNSSWSEHVHFTAPTGMAACQIGGMTLHSWSGIGLGNESAEKLFGKIMGRKDVRRRWKTAKVLFIDEVSMLSAELFDKLGQLARRIRNCDEPFGGLQLVLVGDFYQLPPVARRGESSSFLFQSKEFDELIGSENTIVLDKIFRQKDSHFLRMLNEIREGRVSDETDRSLQAKVRETKARLAMHSIDDDSGDLTRLFSTNNPANALNARELEKLTGERRVFVATDFSLDGSMDKLEAQFPKVPSRLELRVGALVALQRNIDPEAGLVNGTKGRIVGFQKSSQTTVNAESDLGLPIVRFDIVQGREVYESEHVIKAEPFSINAGGNLLMAERIQIPLMLAWAITIHKCQGMTLKGLRVSLNGIFDYGQAYVAISRVTDFEGLYLEGYERKHVKAHPKVKGFYAHVAASRPEHGPHTTVESYTGPIELLSEVLESRGSAGSDGRYSKENTQVSEDDWICARRYISNVEDDEEQEYDSFLEPVTRSNAAAVTAGDSTCAEQKPLPEGPSAGTTAVYVPSLSPYLSPNFTAPPALVRSAAHPYSQTNLIPIPSMSGSQSSGSEAAMNAAVPPPPQPQTSRPGITSEQAERIAQSRRQALIRKAQRLQRDGGMADNAQRQLSEIRGGLHPYATSFYTYPGGP